MSVTNTKWVLKERPRGLVKNENFELIKEEIREKQNLRLRHIELIQHYEQFHLTK